eukprot:gene11812-18230_t
MSGGDSSKDKDVDSDEEPQRRAAVLEFVREGKVEAVLRRSDLADEDEADEGAQSPSVQQPAVPAGRALGGVSHPELSEEDARSKRLAMLQQKVKKPPSASNSPIRTVGTSSPSKLPSTPASPSPPPSVPLAAQKPSTPSSNDTAKQMFMTSLAKENNLGYLVRHVLQIKRSDADFDDDRIPSLLSGIFQGHTEGHVLIQNDSLWAELDGTASSLSEALVEKILRVHPLEADDAFLISAFGRAGQAMKDMFVRESFSPVCTTLRRAIRLHYLSSFIPAMLDEDSPERAKTLKLLLNHPEQHAATDMLSEVADHLSGDEDMGFDVSRSILAFLLGSHHQSALEAPASTSLTELTRILGYVLRLCRSNVGSQVLSSTIKQETIQSARKLGTVVAMQSWARRFLLTPSPEEIKSLLTENVRNYPKAHPSESETLLSRPREIVMGITRDLASLLKDALLKKGAEGRKVTVDWIVVVLRAFQPRADLSKANQARMRQERGPDVFCLNFARVALELAQPVCQKFGEKASLRYASSAAAAQAFPSWLQATRLDKREALAPVHTEESFNFATEILFIAVEAMHCLIMPSVKVARWSHEAYMRGLGEVQSQGGHVNPVAEARLTNIAVQWDYLRMLLLNPSFVDLATKLAVTACSVVQRELQQAGAGADVPDVVLAMPAFIIEDALDWAVFVCQVCVVLAKGNLKLYTVKNSPACWCGGVKMSTESTETTYAPNLVQGAEGMPQLLAFAITACTHPTLLTRQPMLQTRVVALIAAMQEGSQHQKQHDDVWAASQWSAHRSSTSLFNIVESSPACAMLPQVLFRVYSTASSEGFDMDKDDHLSHSRDHVLPLFVQLIVVDRFKAGLIEGLSKDRGGIEGEEDEFAMFVHKLATEATHCLDDALNRMTEVNDIAKTMANKPQWTALSKEQQSVKEHHFQAQGRSARGFMSSAMRCLQVVQMLLNPTRNENPQTVPRAIASDPVLRSIAHLVRYFWAQLHGARGRQLRTLPTPQKYDYDRLKIIGTLAQVVALLSHSESFLRIFSANDDYERWVVLATVQELQQTQIGGLPLLRKMTAFAEDLQRLNPQSGTAPSAELSEAAWNPPSGQVVVNDCDAFREEFEDIHFEAVDLAGENNSYTGFSYKEQLASSSHSSAAAKQLLNARKREWKLFGDLPLYPQASIFIRADETRMDVVKMILTGPEDSPYAYGMFLFDVYLPPSYPDVPPLVTLKTTGGGTVRFNPNLYESGKVCLSLLGTWYGDGAETKWQPGVSSLYQIGTSMQSMILVPDPYFNEPGNERQQGTEEGEKWSADYNEGLRLGTLRYAVLQTVKTPPAGCEELVQKYYSVMAPAVLATAHKWCSEASEARRPKFLKVLEQLREALGDGSDTS